MRKVHGMMPGWGQEGWISKEYKVLRSSSAVSQSRLAVEVRSLEFLGGNRTVAFMRENQMASRRVWLENG